MAEYSEWGFWELLLHRVAVTLSEEKVDADVLAQTLDLHQRATTSGDKVVAQRCFETCLGILCASPDQRLVFVFDQFDQVWGSLEDTPFLVLRSLRD
jgi:hypothetical protein